MELNLKNKVVVVTGASRGIGLAIARAFAQEGARVVAGARTPGEALGELAKDYDVVPVTVDLATAEGAVQIVEAATAYGPVDVLVNNVGAVTPRLGGIAAVTDEEWVATLNINLLSAIRTTRAALPGLIATEGAIVNIGSVNSILPDPSVVDYAVAKAGLASYAKSLSKEVTPQGVRVNTISPGPVETDMWLGSGGLAETIGEAMGVSLEQAVAAVVEGLGGFATGRFTRPEEVADLALFLASERSGNITGADFTIDGGLIKTI
ncbi:oxidoreductase [Nocardioides sp. LHG3406-4]|uniref:oxidoreductase n=1 Tax=Nocardioides sp. LHG3406-4 TaxID=2804575 RepID=UPI003CEF5790